MMSSNTQTVLAPRDHFARIVPQWSHFGPPLRPSADDTAVVQHVADGLAAAAHVVVLGLTPEIIACNWPADTKLSALDHSPSMIQSLWPPDKGPASAQAILGDWCAMPFASGAIDLVVGDGCYVLQTYPEGFERLTHEVRRVLRPGGRFVIRVFLRPDRLESIADIARELALGEVVSVHALKLRLLAALHGASGAGSCLDDVWRAWKSMPSVPAALIGIRGWTAEEIGGIESYQGMSARYYLPTLAEFRRCMESSSLCEEECAQGRHELADRCPTLVLARRS
jgi:SAM-dependent methyltransferase